MLVENLTGEDIKIALIVIFLALYVLIKKIISRDQNPVISHDSYNNKKKSAEIGKEYLTSGVHISIFEG